MLKRSYANETDIPAEYKSQYVQKEGKWVLDVEGFDNVDSVLSKNQELLSQHNSDKTTLSSMQGQLTKANNEKAELAAKAVPDGHVVVPVAEKAYIDKLKVLGAVDEIVTKVTEYPGLKAQAEAVTREQKLTGVAQVLGYNAAAFAKLPGLPAPDAFEIRDKTENGQPVKNKAGENEQVVIVKLSENGQTVERNWVDFFNGNAELKLFEPALTAKAGGGDAGAGNAGRQLPSQTGGNAAASDDPIQARLVARDKARSERPNALMQPARNVAAGAGAQQAAKQTGANP